MLKAKIIITILKAVAWIALIGTGVWYLSSSLGGGSLSYVSLESFLKATGACKDGVCDTATSNGCVFCFYIERLFYTIGNAAHGFWDALIENIWILLALGVAIFMFKRTVDFIQERNSDAAKLDTAEKKFDFKEWWKPVQGVIIRVLIAGALLGMVGYGGTQVLRVVTDITITPVMYVGSELAMAASGVSDAAGCGSGATIAADNIIGPALQPFMCVIGNLNTVVLAGAAGGFSLMNYSWMGLGGGLWTWVAGLSLVLMFLVIGFNIFFKILTVVFQLVFLIIFLPLIIAAWAFEKEWKLIDGAFSNAVGMLAKCAVRVIAITLQILVVYAMVVFAAQEYFPGPPGTGNKYTPILPAGIVQLGDYKSETNMTEQSMSVMDVFAKCERQSALSDGGVDKDTFASCFTREKAVVEQKHPGAFDFMADGWEFFLMLLGLFLVYYYCIAGKIDNMLGGKGMLGSGSAFGGDMGDPFEYGKYVKEFGQSAWRIPQQWLDKIGKTFSKA